WSAASATRRGCTPPARTTSPASPSPMTCRWMPWSTPSPTRWMSACSRWWICCAAAPSSDPPRRNAKGPPFRRAFFRCRALVLLAGGPFGIQQFAGMGHFQGFHGVGRLNGNRHLQVLQRLGAFLLAICVVQGIGIFVVADGQGIGLLERALEEVLHLVRADAIGHAADHLALLADHPGVVAAVQGQRIGMFRMLLEQLVELV